MDGQKLSILSTLPGSTGKSHIGEWSPRMVHKLGSLKEFSALQEHRAMWDRQWSCQLPSSPGRGHGFPGHSSASAAAALLPGHKPASETAPGAAHELPRFRRHTLATLGEEMLWLG